MVKENNEIMNYGRITEMLNNKDMLRLNRDSGAIELIDPLPGGEECRTYCIDITPEGYCVTNARNNSIVVGYDKVPGLDKRMLDMACDGLRLATTVLASLKTYERDLRELVEPPPGTTDQEKIISLMNNDGICVPSVSDSIGLFDTSGNSEECRYYHLEVDENGYTVSDVRGNVLHIGHKEVPGFAGKARQRVDKCIGDMDNALTRLKDYRKALEELERREV